MKSAVKVFKFGGASLRHAAAIRQVKNILSQYGNNNILVVVSAMGKTTNALERVVYAFLQQEDFETEFNAIREYHRNEMKELFPEGHEVWDLIDKEFTSIRKQLQPGVAPDQLYDQVVSGGEMLSSILVSRFLKSQGLAIAWVDARRYIRTDPPYREGTIHWQDTEAGIKSLAGQLETHIILTQGFIGGTKDGHTTTLGREGSDYSAAIFAFCLQASSVTIWKDVPGVMNADPKRLPAAIVFEELPFREAAEMTYYGASVIHPKTIKPLANRGIPLYVKNFDNPALSGTIIHEIKVDHLPPLIVFKDNQCLVSCRVTDYTFVNEAQLSFIFSALSDLHIKINLMQNSAISFSFCIDFRQDKVMMLIERLASSFEVYYNTGLTLITVKNYDSKTFQEYRQKPGILLEQSSRSTLQILVRN